MMPYERNRDVKVFRKDGGRREQVGSQYAVGKPGVKESIKRVKNINLLFNACGRDAVKLADMAYIPVNRLKEILLGDAMVSNELAMHIESQCGLPGGWLDEIDPKIPESVLRRIRGEEKAEDAAGHDETAYEGREDSRESVTVEAQSISSPNVVEPESSEGVSSDQNAGEERREFVSVQRKMGRPFSVSEEVAEARRRNLENFLDTMGKGSRVEFAKNVGVDISVVSSWIKGRRRITDSYAKRIVERYPKLDMLVSEKAKQSSAIAPTAPKVKVDTAAHQQQVKQPAPISLAKTMARSETDILKDICMRRLQEESDPVKLIKAMEALYN